MPRIRASLLGRSVLDLDVDDSKLHSKLSGARVAAEKWTDQTGTSLTKVGKAMSGVGEAWTRNITLPIIGAGAAVGKVALDFDTTFRQIVGLTDVTGDQVDALKDKVLALGPAVGKSPQELAESLYFIVSAGFKADEAMDVLETSAKAAAAGLGETQTVAQVLGSVINAYGRENIDAARAADILTEAVSQGTAEADAFAGVVGRVVPAAASLGVGFDQVTAALAGMTLTGLSAEEAAVGLNQVFISLLKPTSDANDALEEIGLSAEGLRRQLKEEGLLAVLRTLEERFGNNEDAAARVFGNVRALRTVTSLLTLDSEQLNTVFAKVANSAGRLATAYDETEGPGREMARSMARIQAAGITIGDDVLPLVAQVLEEVANQAQHLAEWWDSLDDGTRELIVRALALTATIGPLLIIVGKLTTGVGLLFRGLNLLTKPGGIPSVVKGLGKLGLVGVLVAVAVAGSEASRAFGDFVTELIRGKKAAKEFRTVRDALADLGDVAPLVASALEQAGVSAEELGQATEAAGGDVEKAARAIIDHSGNVAAAIAELRVETEGLVDDRHFEEWDRQAQRGMEGVTGTVTDAADNLPPAVAALLADGAGDVAGGMDTGVVDPVEQAMAKAVEAAGQGANDLLRALTDNLIGSKDDLTQQIEDFVETVTHPYTDLKRRADIEAVLASNAIRQGLRSKDSRVRAETIDFVESLLKQYDLLAPGALASGELVNPSLESGIRSNLDELIRVVQHDVTDKVGEGLDFEDVARQAGLTGIAGYSTGITLERRRSLSNAITGVQADLRAKLAINARDWGSRVLQTYAQGMSDAQFAVVHQAQIAQHTVRDLLGFAGSPLFTHSRELGEGVGSSWIDAIAASIDAGLYGLRAGVGSVGDMMQVQPLTPPWTPAMGALTAPGMASGLATVSRGGELHQHFELTVNGVPMELDSPQAMVDALMAIAYFSDGRVPD